MATTPPDDNQDQERYDQPGRNGLGKFAGMNFARAKNTPPEEPEGEVNPIPVSASSQRGPEAFARMIAPSGVTPDQGCFAFVIGAAVLLVSIGFWFYIYYTHADEFTAPNARKGPSAAQIEKERQEARRNRLNP